MFKHKQDTFLHMTQPYSVRVLKAVVIFSFMVSSTLIYATDPKEEQKNSQKDQEQEQVDASKQVAELESTAANTDQEVGKEDEGVSISNLSFNFIFYLIYKIKYAEIFKLPNHNSDNRSNSVWNGIGINELIQKIGRGDI